jgi:hypothetical protein
MNNLEENEITLKDVILTFQEYFKYLLKKTFYIAIPVLLFGGYMAYSNFTTPATFKADRKFFVEGQGSGSSLGNLGGLLGSIGIRQGKANPYQILEVGESKLLTTDVLLEKVGDANEFLANMIIDEYKLDETWAESNENYLGFRFTHDSIAGFSNLENSALNRLIVRTVSTKKEEPLRKLSLDEDRGYYALNTQTLNPELSLIIDEVTYEKVRYYFEEKVLESYKTNRDILKVKADSVNVLLKAKIFELANFLDSNRGASTYRASVKSGLLQKEIDAYSSAYQEITKSFEMADFTLKNQKPTFMLIDRPFPPLGANLPVWWMGLIRGGILGAMLGIGFFVARKIYLDIMNEPSK